MFSTLRLRQRKPSPEAPDQPPNKPSKCRERRGFCLGGRDAALKEPGRSCSRERDSQHRRSSSRDRATDTFDINSCEQTVTRVVGVCLERDDYGLGINLRGGRQADGASKPLVVSYIKPNSPADREGSLRVGDRLLAVNGRSLVGLCLQEVERAVNLPLVWLTVEYEVSVLSALRAAGPLVVDIEAPQRAHLGLGLIDSAGKVIVSKVHPASLAERCGALLPGDQVLSVNSVQLDGSYSAAAVADLLAASGPLLQMEILPVPSLSSASCPSPSWSQLSSQRCLSESSPQLNRRSNSPASLPPSFSTQSCWQELKVESGVVTLYREPGVPLGLTLRWVPSKMAAVVSDLQADGLADRSGVLQIGDRVSSANGCRPVESCSLDLGPSLTLEVQFDVELHPLLKPGSTVSVQLAKSHASGFGITINGCPEYPSSIVISRIRWGSVAHRCGRLAVGDQLLAVGETSLGGDIHLATSVLKYCPNLVTFTVLKHPGNLDMGYSSSGIPSVDSAVESWDGCNNHSLSFITGSECDESPGCQEDWKESMARSLHSIASQPETSLEVKRFAVGKAAPSPPCPLQTNYRLRSNLSANKHWRQSSSVNSNDVFADLEALEAEFKSVMRTDHGPTFHTFRGEPATGPSPQQVPVTLLTVRLYKDPVYDDFGFSVSDGLYERGVFINRIRPGGPAHLSKALLPYDRIIQVNGTKTEELDCCLTVPLVASSPEPLALTVVRQSLSLQPGDDSCIETATEVHAPYQAL